MRSILTRAAAQPHKQPQPRLLLQTFPLQPTPAVRVAPEEEEEEAQGAPASVAAYSSGPAAPHCSQHQLPPLRQAPVCALAMMEMRTSWT
jgi:hypothetical protein